MDTALSLKKGIYISASLSSYSSTKSLLLVCPECSEPVFLKIRTIPKRIQFFSHYKEFEFNENIYQCALRTEAWELEVTTNKIYQIKHGQLIEKFQKEFYKELLESIGSNSDLLTEFIRLSNFEKLDDISYKYFIDEILDKFPKNEILLSSPNNFDILKFENSIDDICKFLLSQFGIFVGNFIYQCAYFIAVTIKEEIINDGLGSILYVTDNKKSLFIADDSRLKNIEQYAIEILPSNNNRNLAIDKISASLISYLTLKWTYDKKFIPNLFVQSNNFQAINFGSKKIDVKNKNHNRTKKIIEEKYYKISIDEVKNVNYQNIKEKNLLSWYKIEKGIGEKKSGRFFYEGDLLRDMIPNPGWVVRNNSEFINDKNIEPLIVENLVASTSCPDCGTQNFVNITSNIIHFNCSKCTCEWNQLVK